GPILEALSQMANANGVHVVGGGMPEKSDDIARPWNTSVLVAPNGAIVSKYRKVHLFDVSLADGTTHRESAATMPGSEPVSVEVAGLQLGMTVCYDLRFPELFRKLVDRG